MKTVYYLPVDAEKRAKALEALGSYAITMGVIFFAVFSPEDENAFTIPKRCEGDYYFASLVKEFGFDVKPEEMPSVPDQAVS